jgi:hypothetical protein
MTSQVVSFKDDSPPVQPVTRRPSLKRRTLQGKINFPTNSPPQNQQLRSPPPSAQSSQVELKSSSASPSQSHHTLFHLNTTSHSTSHFRGPASSAVFLLNALGGLTGPGGANQSKGGTSRARALTTPISTAPSQSAVTPMTQVTTPPSSHTPTSPKSSEPFSLLRTQPQPLSNPRDHSLLETIYVEMHASRFINLSPLSILGSLLGLHFKSPYLFLVSHSLDTYVSRLSRCQNTCTNDDDVSSSSAET